MLGPRQQASWLGELIGALDRQDLSEATGRRTWIGRMLASSVVFAAPTPKTVSFESEGHTLHGVVYLPQGRGPFPAILYNHGSAPGMISKQAFDALGPVFAR
jgi:dipeptidyl aminopeptidase/acylaminoacyl peptidase